MSDFDYFRHPERRFLPKTSHGALRALSARVLPVEGYIYAATSVRPLDEEPYSIDEIERVLGRENLDVESNLLLVRILERLLRSPEQEIALFAAEGINLIEGRYSSRIEKLKGDLGEKREPRRVAELARLYAELSRLYAPGSSLRGFYLHEAYEWFNTLRGLARLDIDEMIGLIRILIDLGLYDDAARELANYETADRERLLLLEAEIEFQRHHFARVLEICRELQMSWHTLNKSERAIVSHWLGRHES